MSTKPKASFYLNKNRWLAFAFLSIILIFHILAFPLHTFALENEGWVEIRVDVPKDFDETIIATFVQEGTYEEYAVRVMSINEYVSYSELPAGKYSFDGAFLENSDFRYNVSLVNDVQSFEVIADPNEVAVLIELKATYNDAYSDGAGVPQEESKPTEEETIPTPEPTTEPSEENTEPSELESSEAVETPETSEPSETVDDTGFSVRERLIRLGIATGIFIGVVFLFAFLVRRHTKNN